MKAECIVAADRVLRLERPAILPQSLPPFFIALGPKGYFKVQCGEFELYYWTQIVSLLPHRRWWGTGYT